MKQFTLPEGCAPPRDGTSSTCTIAGEDFHYLIHVARKREGSSFPGRDNGGSPVTLTVISVSRDSCTLRIDSLNSAGPAVPPDHPRIALFQCVPKGRKMDLIVRQATETGVAAVYPVESEYSVPRIGCSLAWWHDTRDTPRASQLDRADSSAPSTPTA